MRSCVPAVQYEFVSDRSNGNLVQFEVDGHVLNVATGRGMNIAVVRPAHASAMAWNPIL